MALKFTSNELVEIGRRVQDARVAKRMTQEYVADQVFPSMMVYANFTLDIRQNLCS